MMFLTFRITWRTLAWLFLAIMVLLLVIAGATHADAQSAAGFRNVLIGGDFNTNLWQRGTSIGGIANTATYTADRWAAYGGSASSNISVSQQSITGLTGFSKSLRFQRGAANANTAKLCIAQIVEGSSATPLAAGTAVLSWYALADANFSALSSQIEAIVTTGSVADEGLTALVAGTWTGTANTVDTLIPISTAWNRYSVVFAMPTGTNEIAVQFCYTPVGTAGATDSLQLEAVQLEAAPLNGNPAVAVAASPFERRPIAVESNLQWRYFYRMNEAGGTGYTPAVCEATAATSAVCVLPLPGPMRGLTGLNSAIGAYQLTLPAGTNQAVTAFGGAINGTPNGCAFSVTVAAGLVAGSSTQLRGNSGAGFVACGAEL